MSWTEGPYSEYSGEELSELWRELHDESQAIWDVINEPMDGRERLPDDEFLAKRRREQALFNRLTEINDAKDAIRGERAERKRLREERAAEREQAAYEREQRRAAARSRGQGKKRRFDFLDEIDNELNALLGRMRIQSTPPMWYSIDTYWTAGNQNYLTKRAQDGPLQVWILVPNDISNQVTGTTEHYGGQYLPANSPKEIGAALNAFAAARRQSQSETSDSSTAEEILDAVVVEEEVELEEIVLEESAIEERRDTDH